MGQTGPTGAIGNTGQTGATGLTGVTGGLVTTGYLFAYAIETQQASATGVFQTTVLNNIVLTNGWNLNGFNTFTPTDTGTYLIDYNLAARLTDAAGPSVVLGQVALDGVPIGQSMMYINIGNENASTLPVSCSFIQNVSAGTNLTLQFSFNNPSTAYLAGTQDVYDPGSSNFTITPSASMAITRIN